MHAGQGNIQGLADWGSMPHGVVISVGDRRVSGSYVAGRRGFVNLNPLVAPWVTDEFGGYWGRFRGPYRGGTARCWGGIGAGRGRGEGESRP